MPGRDLAIEVRAVGSPGEDGDDLPSVHGGFNDLAGAGFVSLKVVRFKGVVPYQEFSFRGKVAETRVWRNTWGRKGVDNMRKGYCSTSFSKSTSSPLLFFISGRFTNLEQYYNCRGSCTLF